MAHNCVRCARGGASAPPTPAALNLRGEPACAACASLFLSKRVRAGLVAGPLTGARVALGVGGGACAAAALDAARALLDCGRRRRWWADALAVHVEAACAGPALWLAGAAGDGAAAGAGAGDAAAAAAAASAARAHAASVLESALCAGLVALLVPLESALPWAPLVVIEVRPPPAPPPQPGGGAGAGGGGGAPPDAAARAQVHSVAAVRPAVDAALAALAAARGASRPLSRAGELLGRALAHAALDDAAHVVRGATARLCAEAAASSGASYLLLASSATSVAEGVFCAASGGGGPSVPADAALVDRRWAAGVPRARAPVAPDETGALRTRPAGPPATVWYPAELQQPAAGGGPPPPPPAVAPGGVLVVRPLLELERGELEWLCAARDLLVQPPPSFALARGAKGSAHAVHAAVLAGLAAAFPATVHNVARTARKLALPWDEAAAAAGAPPERVSLCGLCAAVLPPAGGGGGSEGGSGAGGGGGGGGAGAGAEDVGSGAGVALCRRCLRAPGVAHACAAGAGGDAEAGAP